MLHFEYDLITCDEVELDTKRQHHWFQSLEFQLRVVQPVILAFTVSFHLVILVSRIRQFMVGWVLDALMLQMLFTTGEKLVPSQLFVSSVQLDSCIDPCSGVSLFLTQDSEMILQKYLPHLQYSLQLSMPVYLYHYQCSSYIWHVADVCLNSC